MTENPEVLGPTVLNAISVNNSDAVAIATVRHEDALEAQRLVCEADLRKLVAACNIAVTWAEKLEGIQIKELGTRELGKVKTILKQLNLAEGIDSFESQTRHRKSENGVFNVWVVFGGTYGSKQTKPVVGRWAENTVAARKKVVKLQEELQVLQTRMSAIRKELSNIPKLERRAKARMAEAVLARSDDGRKLFSELNELGSMAVLQLPAATKEGK